MLNANEQDFIRFIEEIFQAAQDESDTPKMIFVSWELINRFPKESVTRLEALLGVSFITFHSDVFFSPRHKPDLLDCCVIAAAFFIFGLLL